jgi:two-component system, OmpR family, phosphate regulon sensor histidine kinase PhoR
MAVNVIEKLALLIERERDAILVAWRSQVRKLPSARNLDVPTLNDHVPNLLIELATALRSRSDESIAEAVQGGSPPIHGVQRVKDAFDVEEVVAEYNILRGCIHDLAERNDLSLQGRPFHVLNRVLDGAIGSAVQSFAAEKALEVQRRREEYLAFVAHDLRTPLNAISLSARVLETLLTGDRSHTSQNTLLLKALKRNVRHLEVLVGKVIDENISLETEVGVMLHRREFDLWPLVEGVIDETLPVAEKSMTRLTNAVPEELVAYGDAGLLRRVMQNLIANAIAYAPQGDVTIGALETGKLGEVECFVRDNGAGISPERCPFVFDKNETDPSKEGGLGLGLAIVKQFVEAHNGAVTLESKLTIGSTFRFTLPGRQS